MQEAGRVCSCCCSIISSVGSSAGDGGVEFEGASVIVKVGSCLFLQWMVGKK